MSSQTRQKTHDDFSGAAQSRLLPAAVYLVAFWWFANTKVAHVYPDANNDWWSGLLQGWFALPSFILSWSNQDVTIYQSPNDGYWYNLWYLVGIFAFVNFVRTSSD